MYARSWYETASVQRYLMQIDHAAAYKITWAIRTGAFKNVLLDLYKIKLVLDIAGNLGFARLCTDLWAEKARLHRRARVYVHYFRFGSPPLIFAESSYQ